ncbi:MAG: M16 family metallopeptidase, partial [Pyrinomonadaceae bacterium]
MMNTLRQPIAKASSAVAFIVLALAVVMAQRPSTPPQTSQSIKGAEIKGRAPVNKEVLKVKLPRLREATLPNGLRIVLVESHRVPTFSMQMVILSGGLSDPPDYRGLATFTAALLREGTASRKSKDIAEQIETIGATLTAGSSGGSFTTGINTSGLVENFDQVLDIFADVICHPNFPQDEIDKYKTRQIQQIQFQRAIPQFLSNERFQIALYGSHPAGLSVPPLASLNRALSADLAGFHETYYRPNNSMLVIFGDVTLDQLMPKLTKAFGSWQRKEVPKTVIPAAPPPAAATIQLIDRPGSVQTVLVMGNLSLERLDPDFIPLLVMNQVLGGGPSSRLFMNLREDKGYTYGASSGFSGLKYRG